MNKHTKCELLRQKVLFLLNYEVRSYTKNNKLKKLKCAQ